MIKHYVKPISRRQALGFLGAVGAISLFGCGDGTGGENELLTNSGCILSPELTEGPYFVDELLDRSDIIDGQSGLPLGLTINVYDANAVGCIPLSGVQVDIWHANGEGDYSDVAGLGTAGQTFLRGYQVTDASGNASFTTIYPGWYSGRATHIHLKARIFNSAGNATLEATTQLFFDDTVTDGVYANNAPYNTRGTRDTLNSQDNIYGGNTGLLVALTGSSTSGYAGTMSIGIAV